MLYSLGKAVWNSGTNGRPVRELVMQGDGNLVLYAPDSTVLWYSHTEGHGESWLQIQNDRNVVIYKTTPAGHSATWATHTATPEEWYDDVQIEMSRELRSAVDRDAEIAPLFTPGAGIGVRCSVTPQGFLICLAAAIVVAVVLEFIKGKPPFGEHNDLRVLGGRLSEGTKQGGRVLHNTLKHIADDLPFPRPPDMDVRVKWPPW